MDDITLLLVLEARDKATAILDSISKKIGGYGDATKAASTQATKSAAEIETANTRAAAASASYDRATKSSAEAQAALKESMLASKAAQLEASAAAREGSTSVAAAQKLVTESANAEEAALMRVQEAEKLAATRSRELADAQRTAAGDMEKGSGAMRGLGVAAGATAIGVGAVGYISIKAAADYQSSTNRLVTSAGESRDNIEQVRQGMLKMAGDVGYSTDALSKAMYTVESGGQHGADGLKVLQAAAEGAKTENADLGVVADATTSILKDYHLPADDAASVTSKLVAATSQGKTTFQDLAGAMSAVMPVASAAHVPLNDVLGDLASMTVHGMSAQQASQNLADTIRHMQSPTAQQAKELSLLGMTTNQLGDDLKTKGLSGTLQEISGRIKNMMPPGSQQVILQLGTALSSLPSKVQELGQKLLDGSVSMKEYSQAAGALDPISAKQAMSFATLAGQTHRIGDAQVAGKDVAQTYAQALAKATGDSAGLNTALMLTGDNSDNTNNSIRAVGGAATEAGNHVRGWGDIQSTFNQKVDKLKGSLDGAKVAIGTGLLPAVSTLAGWVTKIVTPVAAWIDKHQKLSGIILGSLGVLALLTVAIWAINAAMGALAANPVVTIIIGIVVAIGLLAAGVMYAWKHWAWFRTAVLDTWNAIKVAAMAVWNDFLKPVFNAIRVAIMDGVVPAALWLWHNALEPAFKGIAAAATWLWGNVLKPIWDALVVTFRDQVGPAVMWLWHNVIEPAWKGIQAAIGVAWTVIKTVFDFVAAVVRDVLAPVFLWLWHNIIEPVWQGIQIVISIVWAIIEVIFGLIQIAVKILAAIFTWLWHNIIEPVWQGIQIAISIAWAIIQVIWGLIQIEVKALAAIFTWLWHNILEPVWQGIAAVITWAWNNIIKPLWEAVKIDIRLLGDVFSWLYHNVIEPVWNGIKDTISAVWNNGIKPVFNFFKNIIKDDVAPAFQAGVDAIRSAWNGMMEVAKAPVKFVVNTVLNDGLLAAYNWIASRFGVKPDDVHVKLPAGFAAGGRIPGSPSDTDNMLAMVATGEHIMPTQRTRRWLPVLESIRLHDRLPKYPGDLSGLRGYAGGGVVGALEGAAGGLWDLFTDPAKLVRGPINAIINSIPGAGVVRDAAVGGAHKLLDGLIHWITGAGGSGSVGGAMAFLKAQAGKPYIWASAGPAGYDCCVPARTMVDGPGGPKRIAEIRAGDVVYSRSDTGGLVERAVIKAWYTCDQQTFRVHLADRHVDASANHPFLRVTADGATEWARLDSLAAGDRITVLASEGFDTRRVLEIEPLDVEPTYDLNVDYDHNFIANGVVVHNSGLVSAVYNVLKGHNPYQHTFSTSDEAPFFPIPGVGGLLTAGWTNPGEPGPGGSSVGHTAGVLAGLPFESTGPGVRMGAGVTPVGAFAHVGHFDHGGPIYPGWNAVYNGTRGMEHVGDPNRAGGPATVVFDLRGSHIMSDRDIDLLIDRIDKRLVRTMLPAAGVQVRR